MKQRVVPFQEHRTIPLLENPQKLHLNVHSIIPMGFNPWSLNNHINILSAVSRRIRVE